MNTAKLIGFLLISFSGFALGYIARSGIYRNADTLARLSDILSRLQSEISYAHSPPEEFFQILSVENNYIGAFFKSVLYYMQKQKKPLSIAWNEALELHSESLCIKNGEKAELARLGKAIGQLDLDGALRAVELAHENFKTLAVAARENKKNEGRLKLALFSTGGILLALLLI